MICMIFRIFQTSLYTLLIAYVIVTHWEVRQMTEVCVCVCFIYFCICVSRCPVDVHRTEPPLQTGAEVIMAAAAAQMEQRGRLPLGGR